MDQDYSHYDVFLGIDVGKNENYAVALARSGDKRLISRAVTQDEAELRALFNEAITYGKTLVVIDQPAGFATLCVSVAKALSLDIAAIPPKMFKKVAQTYGESKSDAKDAFILADASRSMSRVLSPIHDRNMVAEEAKELASQRAFNVQSRTRLYNRLHELLQRMCPSLERLLAGPKLHTPLALEVIARYGGYQGIKQAGKSRVAKALSKISYQSGRACSFVDEVFNALDQQSVAMPGMNINERSAKDIAKRILEINEEIKHLDAEIEKRSSSIPEVELLSSLPGFGKVYALDVALEIGDIRRFATPSKLASYAGLAPKTETSGTSLNRSKKQKGGNRILKNALLRAAQTAARYDPESRAYFEKKCGQGMKYAQALRTLARRRINVIYAMLSNGELYRAQN